jgi:hypothetical protein
MSCPSCSFAVIVPVLPCQACSSQHHGQRRDIDESAANAYEQLKALLVSRYTKACWTRSLELLKYPELGDMKPTDLMWQMKALLPADDRPGTTFMTILLHLPSEMRDHLIAKDFKDCTLMAEYADLLHSSRAINLEYEAAISSVSGGRRRNFSPVD